MNTAMYLNPVTQKAIEILKSLGLKILESASGVLACGETGYGKLLEPDLLFQEIQSALNNFAPKKQIVHNTQPLKKILVTAGGTREPLDDVRFLTNKSTGITGEQIARQLSELGFDVTLDLAESSSVRPVDAYSLNRFDSFSSLSNLLQKQLSEENFDLVIHTAAVSDFNVDKALGKIASSDDLTLHLKRNPKIVNSLKSWSLNKKLKVIAFKLTSQASEAQVKEKVNKLFHEADADLVVQNDAKSTDNRINHQFQIFSKKSLDQASGIDQLVTQIVKEGIL